MGIPESQLETWTHRGAVTTAKNTHESIRAALRVWPALQGRDHDMFLQGSYKNDTNIRGDSDVDLVAVLNETFQHDLTRLTEAEKEAFHSGFGQAQYGWADFRRDALDALRHHFGAANVSEGNKSLKVKGNSGRLPADVVPCIKYRIYQRFWSFQDQGYAEGITFWTQREGRQVINFPVQHYDNGCVKNSSGRTGGEYKPSVRMFKNARTHMVDHDMIAKDTAPSYFVECLLYNVPDGKFSGDRQSTYVDVVNWLDAATLDSFLCQNGILPLFGPSPEQWPIVKAQAFTAALTKLWNEWG